MLVRRQDHGLEIIVAVAREGVGASESRSSASASNSGPGNCRPGTAATEKRSDPLDAQARLLDYANSFEARWRARAIPD